MQTIDGLMSFDYDNAKCQGTSIEEKLCLYGIIRKMAPQKMVEVGSWRGHSACWLALALLHNGKGKLLCVDNFSGTNCDGGGSKKEVEDRLKRAKVDSVAKVRQQNTADFWEESEPDSVDCVFVDAAHDFEAQVADINGALKIATQLVIVHDACSVRGTIEACKHMLMNEGKGCYIQGWRGLFLINPQSWLEHPTRAIITAGQVTGEVCDE